MQTTPLISVVLTSFNHACYLREAVDSILAQTLKDFELIVVDDGSTDGSREILLSYGDKITKLLFTNRLGPSQAMSTGVRNARGEFLALMTSDDVSHPQRLEKQLAAVKTEDDPSFVFTGVTFINDRSELIPPPSWLAGRDVFNFPQTSNATVLKRFFEGGNFICGPTVFLSRKLLLDVAYNTHVDHPFLIQLQDFDLWIRLLKVAKLKMIEEKLFSYRITGSNLSVLNRGSAWATQTEYYLVYKNFFSGLSDEEFYEGFSSLLTKRTDHRRFDEMQVLLQSARPEQKLLGYEMAMDLMLRKDCESYFQELSFTTGYFKNKMRGQGIFIFHRKIDLMSYEFVFKLLQALFALPLVKNFKKYFAK